MFTFLEDLQQINKFARHNQKLEDLKDELKAKENEILTLSDAASDVEEMSLTCDDGDRIPNLVGEIFVMEAPYDFLVLLEDNKIEVKAEIKVLKEQATSIKGIMTDLKTHL